MQSTIPGKDPALILCTEPISARAEQAGKNRRLRVKFFKCFEVPHKDWSEASSLQVFRFRDRFFASGASRVVLSPI